MTGKSEPLRMRVASLHAARVAAARQVQADLRIASLNRSRSSAFLIDFELGADHLDAVRFEDARFGEIHGQIQSRLPAEGRQHAHPAAPWR